MTLEDEPSRMVSVQYAPGEEWRNSIYYCGQEFLRRNGVALIINKRVWNAILGCNLKNDRMISVHFQGKAFSITLILVNVPTTNAEEAEVDWFCEDLQDILELTHTHTHTHKDVLSSWGTGMQNRKSRDTWSNRQVWPWSTKWSRAKAKRVLSREHTGHGKHPLSTTQETNLHTDITGWPTPKSDW